MDATKMDFDVACRHDPVKPTGRIQAASSRRARRAHESSRTYEGLPAAWAEFDAWIAKNGHNQSVRSDSTSPAETRYRLVEVAHADERPLVG